MPVQYASKDIVPLILEASRAAAAAREAGDMAEYNAQKARLEVLNRLYRGFGSTEDLLELEKIKERPLEQIARAGKWVAVGVLALVALPYLQRARR